MHARCFMRKARGVLRAADWLVMSVFTGKGACLPFPPVPRPGIRGIDQVPGGVINGLVRDHGRIYYQTDGRPLDHQRQESST